VAVLATASLATRAVGLPFSKIPVPTNPKGFISTGAQTGVPRDEMLRLLTSAVVQSKEAVLITDAQLEAPGPRVVFINPAFVAMAGYTADEMIGRTPRILQGPRTDPAVLDRLRRNLAQGEPFEGETFNYRKDGTEYIVQWQIAPIRDPGGPITHFVSVQRDVTERRRVELASNRLATIVECSDDAIISKDLNGLVESWNKGAERIFGYTAGEMIGTSITRIIPADRIHEEARILDQLRRGLRVEHLETVRQGKDGRLIDVAVTISPIRDALGGIIGVSKSVREITAQKRAERQIAEQAALLEEARDAIVVRSLDGVIRFWYRGAERMYGWRREEAIGRHIGELVYADRARFAAGNAATIDRGEWQGELQHLTKDRRELTVEAHCTLIRDPGGRPESILSISTDVTERKRLEARFLRIQRTESIGTLASGIAHDLNNILAPIMMSIEMLKGISENPRAGRILETIEVSAKRGRDIVRQPKHLLGDQKQIIRDTFPKNIRLRFTVPGDTWMILGDPTQIHQILMNLCVNARDAMPSGGNLTVSLENSVVDEHYAAMNVPARPGRYVTITVSDTGVGIPPGVIEKIFEPFFTTKGPTQGTGLGLSTVMAIVKSHEGFTTVCSEPGKGTTFTVHLPAAASLSEAPKDPVEEAELPRGKGETVLVVDDEASILSITCQTLEAYGYRTLSAVDGADALAVYLQAQQEIALVLTDMMMPVMDGAALIHALKRRRPGIKIVAASGLGGSGGGSHPAGVDLRRVLTKPYTARTLLKTLRTVLDEP
jgi:PAS domain S-box-containing protein